MDTRPTRDVQDGRGRTLQSWIGFKVPNVKHILPQKTYFTAHHNATGVNDVWNSSRADSAHAAADPHGTRRRCAVTRGAWCGQYMRQQPVPSRPVPRGSRECPNACSGWGNCNHDTGLCECPAGRGGPDCGREVKRPCTNRFRHPHEHDQPVVGHIGPDKHDLNPREPGWLASRCNGYCIDDLALCTCGYDSKFRHIPAPPGSPPWTPPVQWGRPLLDNCMVGQDKDGFLIDWGRPHVKWEDIYGPEGWCNDERSKEQCGCGWDGNGYPCDGSRQHEPFCPNQCTGHGDCRMGFCRCHPGWYGADCSRKKAGEGMEPGYLEQRPWIRRVALVPPAALPLPPAPTRPRPLIYVYDMPPEYTGQILQYRIGADACMWRRFTDGNDSFLLPSTYAVELHLHEMMLQSEHRTFDPEEADFFYVPLYLTCLMWPVLGWADHPWWYAPYAHNRPMHVANLILEAHAWLSSNFPWWNRRGGRDHIWLMAPDEGACYMPSVVYNTSIILTHWGRTDLNHTSGSAYEQDYYNRQMPMDKFGGWPGMDWQNKTRGHPCYDPNKDLVIPAFKSPEHFRDSPLLGAPPLQRDILLYFRGDIGSARYDHYSRGIRQKIFRLAHEGDWARKHAIYIGTGESIPGSYSEHMARSKFCLVAPGDGWSARAEDAVLHGCVPVVIMDGVHAVFESLLDWPSFALRIRESALDASLPALLEGVAPERLARMQRNLARVWHRFAYATGPVMREHIGNVVHHNRVAHPPAVVAAAQGLGPRDTPFRPAAEFPRGDDAFGTIMQWLYHRINETR